MSEKGLMLLDGFSIEGLKNLACLLGSRPCHHFSEFDVARFFGRSLLGREEGVMIMAALEYLGVHTEISAGHWSHIPMTGEDVLAENDLEDPDSYPGEYGLTEGNDAVSKIKSHLKCHRGVEITYDTLRIVGWGMSDIPLASVHNALNRILKEDIDFVRVARKGVIAR